MIPSEQDLERSEEYKSGENFHDHERQQLLPSSAIEIDFTQASPSNSTFSWLSQRFTILSLIAAFFLGATVGILADHVLTRSDCLPGHSTPLQVNAANSITGSTERHNYPPPSPTNYYPSLFPSDIGYAGSTSTGAEPALVATAPAYPTHLAGQELVVPQTLPPNGSILEDKGEDFDLLKQWGNLSPWYSVKRNAFGIDSSPDPPESCRITGLHLLHRHGARYPTASEAYGNPAKFAGRLGEAAPHWEATGDLKFLNNWTYKLGEEILTSFGRQQLFDLGVSMRMKYGFLLEDFTQSNILPVFRTESQDRMLASAQNFALGFFGYPFEGKYQQSVIIEASGFNNTLAPYTTCPNSGDASKADRGQPRLVEWSSIYLQHAHSRLAPQITGFNMTIDDLYALQQMCAYETVALGSSKFCSLFTEEEWEGFAYSFDLYFWYSSAFGSPLSKALGIGYVQELVARLTHTPIQTHSSSTNATLDDNPITFPLNHRLYVDATHDVVVLNVLTALSLNNFAASGPLPADHIPPNRSFRTSELAPFGTNVQFQLLECTSVPGPQIRIIVNDGVSPLTGVKGCPTQRDGMCPVDVFVAAQKETIAQTNWAHDCLGNFEVPDGYQTTTGETPKP